eukprot:1914119-Alexandrium_andersonii.AAC.1
MGSVPRRGDLIAARRRRGGKGPAGDVSRRRCGAGRVTSPERRRNAAVGDVPPSNPGTVELARDCLLYTSPSPRD